MSALLETDGWLTALGGRRPETGALAVEPLGPMGAVEALLADLPDIAEGWLCLASEIWLREGGAWTRVAGAASRFAPDGALILSGEFSLSSQESLHLRRFGGALHGWRYTEGRGDTDVIFDESFRSTEKGRQLGYRVAWRLEPVSMDADAPTIPVWRPRVARFAGWRKS